MKVENAVYPTADGIRALARIPRQPQIAMLNLLKFREKAMYKDGRPDNISGFEAYQRYATAMTQNCRARGRQNLVRRQDRGRGDRRSR